MQKFIDQSIENYAVGIAVIENNQILIVKRKDDDFFGGYYEIPGGKVEKGESFELAAKRELLEETGLEIQSIKSILNGFDYTSQSGKVRQINLIVSVENAKSQQIILSEHDSYAWVNLNQLKNYKFTREMLTCIKEILQRKK